VPGLGAGPGLPIDRPSQPLAAPLVSVCEPFAATVHNRSPTMGGLFKKLGRSNSPQTPPPPSTPPPTIPPTASQSTPLASPALPITTIKHSTAVGTAIALASASGLPLIQPPATIAQPQSKGGTTSTIWEGSKTTLRLVKESADAFPPLKSTVGGLLGLIDLFEVSLSN
jgi:hypothetical protein